MSAEVIVRHLPHRRVRPYRVYYLDHIGRAVKTGKGFNTFEAATQYAERMRAVLDSLSASRGNSR